MSEGVWDGFKKMEEQENFFMIEGRVFVRAL